MCVPAKSLSHAQLFVTPCTVAHLAPLSMGFSRQEDWNGLPCPPSGDLPDPGIRTVSLLSPALAGGFFTTRASWETQRRQRVLGNHAGSSPVPSGGVSEEC